MPCFTKGKPGERMFICGDALPEEARCADCGDMGEFLCDYPVGDGLTCDRQLCDAHATEIAPNLHYCAPHRGMWEGYRDGGGVRRELENVVPYKKAVKP